jgi:hypothetical protein
MNMAALRNQEKAKQAEDASLYLSAPGLPGTAPLNPPMPPGMPAVSPGVMPGVNGEPARPKVASTAKVWGDDEAVAAGIYDAPKPTGIAPPAPPQPSPVAQAFSAMPSRSGPQIPADVGVFIQRLLKNPATRSQGLALYGQWAKPREPEKPPEALRIVNEMRRNPQAYGFSGPDDPAMKEVIQGRLGGRTTNVTVDQRGEGEFAKVGNKLMAERFDSYVKAGDDARGMIADMDSLREIGSRITTGKTAEITAALGPYAEVLGVPIDKLSDLQAYRSIVTKMAPRMRPPGSGATSDFEMRAYLEALPGLGKTPGGNEIIANTAQAIMEHRLAVADIASRALAGELPAREAERQIRALPDPLAMWKQSRGKSPAASPEALRKKYNLE